MFETTQIFSRLLALVASTAIFAGLWANDQPVAVLAIKNAPIDHSLAAAEPEWTPVIENALPARKSPAVSEPVTLEVSFSSVAKQIVVESRELQIAPRILKAHLDQLPIGVAAGDYRIVDSMGGVGWLRVREGETAVASRSADRILVTTVEEDTLRFIPVAPSTVQTVTDDVRR